MVVDSDIGYSDALKNFGMLAVTGQIQHGGLRVAACGGKKSCNENGCERQVSAHSDASRGISKLDDEAGREFRRKARTIVSAGLLPEESN
jgi:hypothetical protein